MRSTQTLVKIYNRWQAEIMCVCVFLMPPSHFFQMNIESIIRNIQVAWFLWWKIDDKPRLCFQLGNKKQVRPTLKPDNEQKMQFRISIFENNLANKTLFLIIK